MFKQRLFYSVSFFSFVISQHSIIAMDMRYQQDPYGFYHQNMGVPSSNYGNRGFPLQSNALPLGQAVSPQTTTAHHLQPNHYYNNGYPLNSGNFQNQYLPCPTYQGDHNLGQYLPAYNGGFPLQNNTLLRGHAGSPQATTVPHYHQTPHYNYSLNSENFQNQFSSYSAHQGNYNSSQHFSAGNAFVPETFHNPSYLPTFNLSGAYPANAINSQQQSQFAPHLPYRESNVSQSQPFTLSQQEATHGLLGNPLTQLSSEVFNEYETSVVKQGLQDFRSKDKNDPRSLELIVTAVCCSNGLNSEKTQKVLKYVEETHRGEWVTSKTQFLIDRQNSAQLQSSLGSIYTKQLAMNIRDDWDRKDAGDKRSLVIFIRDFFTANEIDSKIQDKVAEELNIKDQWARMQEASQQVSDLNFARNGDINAFDRILRYKFDMAMLILQDVRLRECILQNRAFRDQIVKNERLFLLTDSRIREVIRKELQEGNGNYQPSRTVITPPSREIQNLPQPNYRDVKEYRSFISDIENVSPQLIADIQYLRDYNAQSFKIPGTGDCGLFVLGIPRKEALEFFQSSEWVTQKLPNTGEFFHEDAFTTLSIPAESLSVDVLSLIGHQQKKNIFIWEDKNGQLSLANGGTLPLLYDSSYKAVHILFVGRGHYEYLVPKGEKFNDQRQIAANIHNKTLESLQVFGNLMDNQQLYDLEAQKYFDLHRTHTSSYTVAGISSRAPTSQLNSSQPALVRIPAEPKREIIKLNLYEETLVKEIRNKFQDDSRPLRAVAQGFLDDNLVGEDSRLRILSVLGINTVAPTVLSAPSSSRDNFEASRRVALELQAQEHQRARQIEANLQAARQIQESDFEKDRRLAQQLQAEEQTTHERVLRDQALATQWTQNGRARAEPGTLGRGYRFPTFGNVTQEDMNTYHAIAIAAPRTMDLDVHRITAAFARPNYPAIKQLEQKYMRITNNRPLLSPDDIQRIVDGLSTRVEHLRNEKGNVDTAIANIRNYYRSPVDNETGLDIQEVISTTFTLAGSYGEDALVNLYLTMADNRATGGGCHPGITGRLVQQYITFVSAAFQANLRQ